MANYNVGNIEVGVISSSKNALSGIDKTIAKLRELDKVEKSLSSQNIDKATISLENLGKVNLPDFSKQVKSISKLNNVITKLSQLNTVGLTANMEMLKKSINDIAINLKLPDLTETTKSLRAFVNTLSRLNKVQSFDTRKLYTSFNSLTRIMQPFLTMVKESESSLNALSNALNNLKVRPIRSATKELKEADKQAKSLKTNTQQIGFNFKNMFDLGKLYLYYNYSKRIAQSIGKVITYASDYVEILNKFQVSFGDLYQDNLKLVNQLAQAFSFSTNTLMDYTATFNNMLKGLKGLTEETSAIISQTLTKMAIDYSSLFNVSLQSAMEAFQSAISGNIRTLRSISGFDVSEITIFSIYQQLGGTKSMRQLNQLEKRLLRIIAIQQQMSATGTLGDYGRTINCGFDKKLSNENRAKSVEILIKGKYRDNFINCDKVIKYCRA